MFELAHKAGICAALDTFGVKTASGWGEFTKEVKRQAVGNPTETFKQLRKGTLFKPGKGLLHEGLPRTPGQIAAALAWPVMGSILLARNAPATSGGEVVGDFLGRSVGSLVGGPLGGAVGQIGGGMLLAPVGRAVGKAFDSHTGQMQSDSSEPVAAPG